MTALTPLYTRGVLGSGGSFPPPIATVGQGEKVQAADFFHWGEDSDPRLCRPILPGSSLRGMFEAVFEIMAQSRPRFVSDHRPFYRYFAAGQLELRELYASAFRPSADLVAGILRQRPTPKGSEWYIEASAYAPPGHRAYGFVAVSAKGLPPSHQYLRGRRSSNNVYDARPQHVTVTGQMAPLLQGGQALNVPEAKVSDAGTPGALNGYLILPGPDLNRRPPNQHEPARSWYQVILDPRSSHGSREYIVPQEVYGDYLEWGRSAHGSRFSKNNREAPRQLVDGSPAFGLISTQNPDEVSTIGANMMVSLRHTASPKEVALRSYQAILPAVDMAQALFGYVPTTREAAEGMKAIRGRVFVEDAECASPTWYLASDDPVQIPPRLLGPKTTAIQMYLQQQPEHPLHHYSSAEARVQGFKRYWHNPAAVAPGVMRSDKGLLDSTETRMCPVKSKTKFVGRVRFENLTDAELGGLYACIQLPWSQEQQVCLAHKFGMGKSFGFGSLRVEETRIVFLDMQERYSTFRRTSEKSIAGQLSDEEARLALSRGYRAFVERVGKNETLWRRPPLKALANLLAWEPAPQGEIRTVGVETSLKKSGFDPLARQWKDRVPLGKVINRIDSPIPDVVPFASVNEAVPTKLIPLRSNQTLQILDAPLLSANKPQLFNKGDEILVTVQRRFGRSQGDVLIDNGTLEGRLIRNVQIGEAAADDRIFMIVTAVNGDGVVTGVKRGPAA